MPDEPFVSFFDPSSDGDVPTCDVIVNSARNDDQFVMRRAMSLDVVHCFQSLWMGSDAGFEKQVPAWAWEGPAQYIHLESFPPITNPDALSWQVYFSTPEDPLFVRSYDAIGFYAQALKARRGPVDRLPGGAHRRGRCGALRAGGRDFGPLPWTAGPPGSRGSRSGAGIGTSMGPAIHRPISRRRARRFSVSNGSDTAVSEDAYTNGVYVLDSGADIVEVHGTGHLRIGDGTI